MKKDYYVRAISFGEALREAKKSVRPLRKNEEIIWWKKEIDRFYGKNWDWKMRKPLIYKLTYEIKRMRK